MTRETIELRHKVLLQRIDRLYGIFEVVSTNGQYTNKLNAIIVLKEQYNKMYTTILEKNSFWKYEEVENTITLKLAQIEHELDVYVYRTSKNFEQLLDSYIKEIEKYNNFDKPDELLEKIKSLKQILKLYRTYINQEQLDRWNNRISALKFDILLRKQIKDMDAQTTDDIPNLLDQYDTQQEKSTFETLIGERFKGYVSDLNPNKRRQSINNIMQDSDYRAKLLKKQIDAELLSYAKRFVKVQVFVRGLYKVEKINKKIDTTQILIWQGNIGKCEKELNDAISNWQYSKYLELRAKIIPRLEAYERKIEELGGLDYILDTVNSKQYHLNAVLEEHEETPKMTLNYIMKSYNPDIEPSEDERYKNALKMYDLRNGIRTVLTGGYKYFHYGWLYRQHVNENEELNELFNFPIFDKNVLTYDKGDFCKFPFLRGYAKCEYLSELMDGKYSLSDCIAMGSIYRAKWWDIICNENSMNFAQKLVWKLYDIKGSIIKVNKLEYVYYLIELDEEVVVDTGVIGKDSEFWPVGGEEYYKVPNFHDVPYSGIGNVNDLGRLYVRTKHLLMKKRELKLQLDETKMRKLSNEEAEELKQKVHIGDLSYNVDNIINSIFDLWPETDQNKQRRTKVKNAIRRELIKMGSENYLHLKIEKIECHELYEAIKNEINRIRQVSPNYINCHDMQGDIEKIVYYISFINEFLDNEIDFEGFAIQVEFDLRLRLQLQKILYENGGEGRNSEFSAYNNNCGLGFFNNTAYDFYERFSEYLGKQSIIVYRTINSNIEVNEMLLEDMNNRPEKYLFVLQAPEENSIVPKETREKIEQCAQKIASKKSEGR